MKTVINLQIQFILLEQENIGDLENEFESENLYDPVNF